MKQTLVAALLMGYVIAFAGCNGNPPQEVPDAELMGTLWTLKSIEVPGAPAILPDAKWTYPIQFFEDNRIEGGIACNHLDGEYMLTAGDSIRFKNLGATKLGCGESGNNSIENRLLMDLGAVHSYEIIGNQLLLYFDDSALKFRYME